MGPYEVIELTENPYEMVVRGFGKTSANVMALSSLAVLMGMICAPFFLMF